MYEETNLKDVQEVKLVCLKEVFESEAHVKEPVIYKSLLHFVGKEWSNF